MSGYCTSCYTCVNKQARKTYLWSFVLCLIAETIGFTSAWISKFHLMISHPSRSVEVIQAHAYVGVSPTGCRETMTQRSMVHPPGECWWQLLTTQVVVMTVLLLQTLLKNIRVSFYSPRLFVGSIKAQISSFFSH